MARVYKRDSRGRFAGGGGDSSGSRRPPARPVSRGTNRLTRDNAGRITSVGGSGATARGGRLRTAAGNQRATQTARIKGTGSRLRKPAGAGKVNVQVGTGTAATKAMVRGNFRPRGVMAKPGKGENPFVAGSTTAKDSASRLANAKIAKDFLEKRGHKVSMYSGPKHVPARYNETKGVIEINRAATHWQNPRSSSAGERKGRFWSTSSPVGTLLHEAGHRRSNGTGQSWITASRGGSMEDRIKKGSRSRLIAGRVSRYATTNPAEFIAETYAGRRTGRRYDSEVMSTYRAAAGLPGIRTGSRVKPGGKPQANPRAVSRDRKRRRRG